MYYEFASLQSLIQNLCFIHTRTYVNPYMSTYLRTPPLPSQRVAGPAAPFSAPQVGGYCRTFR